MIYECFETQIQFHQTNKQTKDCKPKTKTKREKNKNTKHTKQTTKKINM